MISKADIKRIRSLAMKKFRTERGEFVAEGPKLVSELMSKFTCRLLIATEEWMKEHKTIKAERAETVSEKEMAQASLLQSPREVLAIFSTAEPEPQAGIVSEKLCLALDGIQDPGNLGTIVRIADWFGITDIFCSFDTADVYAPKAMQATMGAIARVNVYYTNLKEFIGALPPKTPVYGTFLDGDNIYQEKLSGNGLIIMGNEGNGISPGIAGLVSHRLLIPSYPTDRPTSESLNVAIATAITCSEFRRGKQ